jgi:small GTP-binding protein
MVQKKVCMLGSFSVGKTSLVRRFVESIFDEKYHTTIGVKVDKKVVQASGEEVTLVLWDLHGEDAFQKMRMSYLRGMSGYLLVIDPTRRQTLEDALSLQERVEEAMGAIPSILVLNKHDLLKEWDIDLDRVTLLEERGQTVIRASAKTGEGVEQGFSRLASAMLQSPA